MKVWVFFLLHERIYRFFKNFERAVLKARRDIDEIELIAVSKKKPTSLIREVIQNGYQSFGENQLQEVENKWIDLKKNLP